MKKVKALETRQRSLRTVSPLVGYRFLIPTTGVTGCVLDEVTQGWFLVALDVGPSKTSGQICSIVDMAQWHFITRKAK